MPVNLEKGINSRDKQASEKVPMIRDLIWEVDSVDIFDYFNLVTA